MKVGFTVDLAIPVGFAFAIGAVRVAAVRSGRIRLAEHEASSGRAAGGHTLERHIGKTPEELIERLRRRPGLDEVSSFRNIAEAEKLISQVLRNNKAQIEMLVKHVPPNHPGRMRFSGKFANQTGIMMQRGSSSPVNCYSVRVSLEFTYYNGKPFFILTAFPEI